MSDYTPTTKDVRGDYAALSTTYAGKPSSESGAEFDRWLTEVIRKAKDDAWQEGYRSGHSRAMRRMSDEPSVPPAINPYTEES